MGFISDSRIRNHFIPCCKDSVLVGWAEEAEFIVRHLLRKAETTDGNGLAISKLFSREARARKAKQEITAY